MTRLKAIGVAGLLAVSLGAVLLAQGVRIEPGDMRIVGSLGVGGPPSAQIKVSIPIAGATADATGYGPGLQITGPASNFGQMIGLVRAGVKIWSIGYAYNTSVFAIGNGQSTGSNFTEAAAALTIQSTGEVAFPLQPGFSAWNGSLDSHSGVSSVDPVDMDQEEYDTGSDFASDTFTAPVTGKYRFCGAVRISNNTGTTRRFTLRTTPTNPRHLAEQDIANGSIATLSGCTETLLSATNTVRLAVDADASATFTIGGVSGFTQYSWFTGSLQP